MATYRKIKGGRKAKKKVVHTKIKGKEKKKFKRPSGGGTLTDAKIYDAEMRSLGLRPKRKK
jgi:hypothetical protein